MFLQWALKPTRSASYSIRAGNGAPSQDATTYTPGGLVSIDVNTLAPDMKWRGIILSAFDAAGEAVGSWQLAPADDADFNHFGTPASCPHALTHTHALLKPFHVGMQHFAFVAPPRRHW